MDSEQLACGPDSPFQIADDTSVDSQVQGSSSNLSSGVDFNDDDPLFQSDEFRMYCYKVLPCAKRFCHDWSTCPFAHFSERAKRRDPRSAKYTAIACPEMKKQGEPCPRGDKCPYSHNTFEYWLHPTRYRTRMCRDGEGCTRKVCFFAHKPDEIRVPPCRPSLPVADDSWSGADDASGMDATFGAPADGAGGLQNHRRTTSLPTDILGTLPGRLGELLRANGMAVRSNSVPNGFHQPSNQGMGSTFVEKVLESIKENTTPTSAPNPAPPSTIPQQNLDPNSMHLANVVQSLLGNLYAQNQNANMLQQQNTALLAALSANGMGGPVPPTTMGQSLPPPYLPPPNPIMQQGGGVPVSAMPAPVMPPVSLPHETVPGSVGMVNGGMGGGNVNELVQMFLNMQIQSPVTTSMAMGAGLQFPGAPSLGSAMVGVSVDQGHDMAHGVADPAYIMEMSRSVSGMV